MLSYYVYAYVSPKTGLPYYIGKGKGNRAYDKNHHLTSVPKDTRYIIILERNLTDLGACAIERRLIRWYGRKEVDGGILRNLLEGGTGGKQPPSVLKKISEKTKIHQRKAVKEGTHHFLGGELQRRTVEEGKHPMHNDETRRRVTEKMARTKNTKEWKETVGKIATQKRLEKIDFAGEKNPRAIRVIIHGNEYGTIKEASTALNISPPTIRKRLRDDNNKDYVYGG